MNNKLANTRPLCTRLLRKVQRKMRKTLSEASKSVAASEVAGHPGRRQNCPPHEYLRFKHHRLEGQKITRRIHKIEYFLGNLIRSITSHREPNITEPGLI
jgi:hypothetical protein